MARDEEQRALVLEMESHLEQIRRDARGNRRRELEALFLMALEREGLAAVGYGGEGIRDRVANLRADEATRKLVDYALRWAARDEGSHVVLARGLLVRIGGFGVAMRRFAARLGGLVAGWATAVLHHTTVRRAPFSQLWARIIVALGRLGGKVPQSAAGALRHQSFKSFCGFQVGAEKTAVISWDYIAGLFGEEAAYAELAPLVRRIAEDEHKHEQVLTVLYAAFDDDDQLNEGYDAARLAAELEAVDPAFVRSGVRSDARSSLGGGARSEHWVGQGGRVTVREDPAAREADPEALRALLRKTLADAGLLEPLDGARVAIKTTFMMTYDRRDPSPHVDLVLAEELARVLREQGASDVAYLEAPNHYDVFFEQRSVLEVARYLGFESPHYRVVDVAADQVPYAFRRGVGQDSVSGTWKNADLRIAFGKMRSHPSWLVHLSTCTLESLGRPIDELLFHDREADLNSAQMMLLDAFPPDFALLDATHHVPDGLTGILGDPTPSFPGRIYAARDPLALDLVAARHMGILHHPSDASLALALDWFDDPQPRLVVDGPDTRIADFKSPHRNDFTVFLASLAYPVYAFVGRRGNLWMPAMDREAFPVRGHETVGERVMRPLLRGLFGYGKPEKSQS